MLSPGCLVMMIAPPGSFGPACSWGSSPCLSGCAPGRRMRAPARGLDALGGFQLCGLGGLAGLLGLALWLGDQVHRTLCGCGRLGNELRVLLDRLQPAGQ